MNRGRPTEPAWFLVEAGLCGLPGENGEEDLPAGLPYDDPEYREVSRDITLSEPLVDRSVIDGSTGEEAVCYPPGSTTGFPGGPVWP